jgi:hypothetical protein
MDCTSSVETTGGRVRGPKSVLAALPEHLPIAH